MATNLINKIKLRIKMARTELRNGLRVEKTKGPNNYNKFTVDLVIVIGPK